MTSTRVLAECPSEPGSRRARRGRRVPAGRRDAGRPVAAPRHLGRNEAGGAFNADPLAALARDGQLPHAGRGRALASLADLAKWTADNYPARDGRRRRYLAVPRRRCHGRAGHRLRRGDGASSTCGR